MPRAGAGAVAQGLAEGGTGVLQGLLALFVPLLGGPAQVVARLLAEVLLDGLGDQVGDHGFQRGDKGFLGGLQYRLQYLLGHLLEEFAQNQPGGGGRAQRAELGQAQGEGGGGLGRDDLDGQDDQLGDDRHLQPDDEHRRGVQADGDQLGALAGVVEVARAAAELLPGLGEALDGVAGVLGEDVAGGAHATDLEALYVGGELAPGVGAFHHFVFVAGGPLETAHFENPLKCVRQHQSHDEEPPLSPMQCVSSRPWGRPTPSASPPADGSCFSAAVGGAVRCPVRVRPACVDAEPCSCQSVSLPNGPYGPATRTVVRQRP